MSTAFKSTRGDKNTVTASMAIVKGIAPDGGLFVPEKINTMDFTLNDIKGYDYRTLAYRVLRLILDDFTEDELKYCINNAYDSKFDTELIAPLKEAGGDYFLELFHGRTLAFKDMALSILPYLLKTAAKKNGIDKNIVILTATSGDTGKAALEGFADVDGTSIIVFFPESGVSDVQKAQMVTQTGKNTTVAGIKGNFDDAQSAVKAIFTDKALAEELSEKGYVFSSANSINIGRLAPQIVYYFYAYAQLMKDNAIKAGDEINFTVPTGNFGDILAGWYAKKMGLPIKKLICASNDNKVLYDFFRTGEYNINRDFIVTISPSMDILISSNLERFLYHSCESTDKTAELMSALAGEKKYTFEIKNSDISAEYATIPETCAVIKEKYDSCGYIMDTHTAVAYASLKKYREETGDNTLNVVVSTASPYKFAKDVCTAIDDSNSGLDPFAALDTLSSLQKSPVPEVIKGINNRPVLHKSVIEKTAIKDFVRSCLK